jgi:hypothetical protein
VRTVAAKGPSSVRFLDGYVARMDDMGRTSDALDLVVTALRHKTIFL